MIAVYGPEAEPCIELEKQAVRAAGYPIHRTDILDMKRVSGNNPARSRLTATLKAALDPENLIAPGRYATSS